MARRPCCNGTTAAGSLPLASRGKKATKLEPFTQSNRSELDGKRNAAGVFQGLGRTYYAAPGATQHHDRVLRREQMGQKMTPKDDVRLKRK